MSWDSMQQEILHELGLRSYVLASQAGRLVPGAAPMSAPVADKTLADTRVAAAPVPHTLTPALHQALALAGGCTPDELRMHVQLANFRPDPAGKRALWPTLRRLRAARR